MRIAYPAFDEAIELCENKISVIVIENQDLFVRFQEEMDKQLSGLDGSIVISEGDKEYPVAKTIDIISSFVPFEICTKANLNRVVKGLSKNAYDEEMLSLTMDIQTAIMRYIGRLCDVVDIPIAFDEPSIDGLLKTVNLAVDVKCDTLEEKILEYMHVKREVEGERVFILVNLRSYIPDKRLEKLYETIIVSKYRVILLESMQRERLNYEKYHIIDSDLCVIQ